MSQAERDRLEEERIAKARAQREALLSGRAPSVVTEVAIDIYDVKAFCSDVPGT